MGTTIFAGVLIAAVVMIAAAIASGISKNNKFMSNSSSYKVDGEWLTAAN